MQTPILDGFFASWATSVFGPTWRTAMPEIEQEERRRAFYSGFASYYFFSMETAGTLSQAQAEKRLLALSAEIKSYFEQIKRVPRDAKAN